VSAKCFSFFLRPPVSRAAPRPHYYYPQMSAMAVGVMGAMLSITGIFGMAAYSVSKGLRELGIRIVLGAQRKEVLEAALGRAIKLLALGSAAGLLMATKGSQLLCISEFPTKTHPQLTIRC
jgi:hypothetical protein